MLLLDRDIDYAAMLRHHTAYNSLVHDVLGMRFNRVTTVEGKKVDVETADPFWLTNAGLAFPAVADHVDQALNDYRQEKERILRSTGVNVEADPTEIQSDSNLGDSAVGRLRLALKVVPELTERKRIIDCHFQLCCSILERIKERNLGDLLLVEQNFTEQAVMAAIRAPGGRAEDKLRLFLCYYLTCLPHSTPDVSAFEAALLQAGCKLDAVGWAKRIKSLRAMQLPLPQASSPVAPLPSVSNPTAGNDDLLNRFKQFGPSTLGGMFSSVVSGVKALLPESTDIPLVKQVEQAIDSLTEGKNSNVMTIDPRVKPTATAAQKPGHLILFITGGSNYSEYNACHEFIRKRNIKYPLTFGTTDLIGGDDFLEQLGRL